MLPGRQLYWCINARGFQAIFLTHMNLLLGLFRITPQKNWAIRKAKCWRIDVFELWYWRRLLGVPWTARSKPVNLQRTQSWIFTGRTNAEAEAPILWPPDVKNHLTGKDPDAGKDWGQEEKEVAFANHVNSNLRSTSPSFTSPNDLFEMESSWHEEILHD